MLFFLWDGITNLFYYRHVGNTGIYSHCIVSCPVYSVSSFFILAHWNLNGKVWRNWKTGFFSFNAAYYISEIIYTRHPHMQMLFFVCMKQTFCWHIEIGTAVWQSWKTGVCLFSTEHICEVIYTRLTYNYADAAL